MLRQGKFLDTGCTTEERRIRRMASPSVYDIQTGNTNDGLLMTIVVEMNRLLTGMIQVIQEVDTNTGVALCNDHSCPTMSAGR